MDARRIVAAKRDGRPLGQEELASFVDSYVRGKVSEAQAAALLMAIYLNGMSMEETIDLTEALVGSGGRLDLSSISRPTVDKHSTGGVSDGVTLVFAPLAASLGLGVAKLSGGRLAHTGGTLDKLQSIPGLRTDLAPAAIVRQVEEIGCAVAAHGPDLVPADRKLYALRDVTATVTSIPLIASSIMSKKLAVGSDLILLDIKAGSGALMEGAGDADRIARACTAIADHEGRRLRAAVTDMSQPLGEAVGDALEVREAIEVLAGQRKGRLRELVLAFVVEALTRLTGVTAADARGRAERALEDGSALERFARMVEAQEGDPAVAEDPARVLPAAEFVTPLRARATGWLASVDAKAIGAAVAHLRSVGSEVRGGPDPAVGLILRAKTGDRVSMGDAIGEVHTRDPGTAEIVVAEVAGALRFSEERVDPPVLVKAWSGDAPPAG